MSKFSKETGTRQPCEASRINGRQGDDAPRSVDASLGTEANFYRHAGMPVLFPSANEELQELEPIDPEFDDLPWFFDLVRNSAN